MDASVYSHTMLDVAKVLGLTILGKRCGHWAGLIAVISPLLVILTIRLRVALSASCRESEPL